MKHPSGLRLVVLHGLALAVLGGAAAFGLAACEKQDRDSIGATKPEGPPPDGPHIDLNIEASKDTRYQMLCDVSVYKSADGVMANRFGVEKAGPYHDYIPSPTAHCTAKIVAGPGPLTVHLSKAGAQPQSMTITTVGDAGKSIVHMW